MEAINAPSVVCLGFFDGVHKGHLSLLRAAKDIARDQGLIVCVHTFDRAPGEKDFVLTTLAEREALLRAAGADRVAVSAFSEDMRRMSGDDFFRQIVLGSLNARHVVCGDDHRFGYKGGWGVKELEALCRQNGVGLTVCPPVSLPDGTRVSSTAIRKAILAGNIPLAEEMLERPLTPALRQICERSKIAQETLA
ncbi:MAG: adenylyltransferase/cytidyltransferase family protein [Clostridia bacterium]|nr:adenylyltransferase/cytidyltransferase family protein [Clostridia bacterium]